MYAGMLGLVYWRAPTRDGPRGGVLASLLKSLEPMSVKSLDQKTEGRYRSGIPRDIAIAMEHKSAGGGGGCVNAGASEQGLKSGSSAHRLTQYRIQLPQSQQLARARSSRSWAQTTCRLT
jgi:hypothetical protein